MAISELGPLLHLLPEGLDEAALEKAARELVRRNPGLRKLLEEHVKDLDLDALVADFCKDMKNG